MWIIDRYVLRQYLRTFLICYLSLMGLYVVFDACTNLEEFLRCGREQGSILGLIGSFYGYRSVLFFDQASGLLSLVSAMFTVTWIQRHNELTALMAAGISRTRVVVPVIVAAIGVSVAATACRELVIPQFRDQLSRRPRDLIGDVGQDLKPCYDNQTDVLIRGEKTFDDEQRIARPTFLLPLSLDRYGKQLVATEAFYRPPQEGRPGGYLLSGVSKPAGLAKKPSLKLDDQPIVITPHDEPDWLEPDQCFVASDLTFEQLSGGMAWREYSSTLQLIRGLHNQSLDFEADVRVAVHARIVQPILDVTLLFLGLPIVLRRESRNVFMAIGLCGVVVSIFMLVVVASQHLGTIHSVSPALGAWLPLLIFVPVAVTMADAMRH